MLLTLSPAAGLLDQSMPKADVTAAGGDDFAPLMATLLGPVDAPKTGKPGKPVPPTGEPMPGEPPAAAEAIATGGKEEIPARWVTLPVIPAQGAATRPPASAVGPADPDVAPAALTPLPIGLSPAAASVVVAPRAAPRAPRTVVAPLTAPQIATASVAPIVASPPPVSTAGITPVVARDASPQLDGPGREVGGQASAAAPPAARAAVERETVSPSDDGPKDDAITVSAPDAAPVPTSVAAAVATVVIAPSAEPRPTPPAVPIVSARAVSAPTRPSAAAALDRRRAWAGPPARQALSGDPVDEAAPVPGGGGATAEQPVQPAASAAADRAGLTPVVEQVPLPGISASTSTAVARALPTPPPGVTSVASAATPAATSPIPLASPAPDNDAAPQTRSAPSSAIPLAALPGTAAPGLAPAVPAQAVLPPLAASTPPAGVTVAPPIEAPFRLPAAVSSAPIAAIVAPPTAPSAGSTALAATIIGPPAAPFEAHAIATEPPATTGPTPGTVPSRPAVPLSQPAMPIIQPALHAFAAMRQALVDERAPGRRPGAEPASPVAGVATASARGVIAPAARDATLDMTDQRWPQAMAAQIERLRDAAEAGSTRIRLFPDALGRVDVAVRRDGDAVHVHFTAAEPATRQLLADAQPQLTQAAEERGVRLGRTEIGGGELSGGDRQPPGAPAQSFQPLRPTPSRPIADAVADAADDTDARIA